MPVIISDNATDRDQLGRAQFAAGLADLIIDAPHGSSFRLGVFGDWGEGKTSVLRMMEQRIRAAGHVCAWFVPWGTKDQEELLGKLLEAIAEEVNPAEATALHLGAIAGKGVKDNWESIRTLWSELADSDWKFKLADKVIGGVVRTGVSRFEGWQESRLLRSLSDFLGEKKLVVLVDDLDRAKPDLLPDLLLTLREAFDLPNLYYVIAVSPQVVGEGLHAVHPGWDDPLSFLEKIVEYPTYLPAVSVDAVEKFVTENAEDLPGVDAQIVRDLAPHLPRNPRRAKLFLRYLAGLRSQLDRFEDAELNRPAVYLAQLLRAEFPEETRRLLEDPAALGSIENSHMAELLASMDDRTGKERAPRPEERFAPDDQAKRARFLSLCAALREIDTTEQEYPLRTNFLIIEEPPLITWKEYLQLVRQFSAAHDEARTDVLRNWFAPGGQRETPLLRALFAKTVAYRERILDRAADDEAHTDTEETLAAAATPTDMLFRLIREVRVFSSGFLGQEEWISLFGHLLKWSRFQKPKDVYSATREEELILFDTLVRDLRPDLEEELYNHLFNRFEPPKAESRSLQRKVEQLERQLERTIADQILDRFRRSDGLDGILGGGTSLSAESQIAF